MLLQLNPGRLCGATNHSLVRARAVPTECSVMVPTFITPAEFMGFYGTRASRVREELPCNRFEYDPSAVALGSEVPVLTSCFFAQMGREWATGVVRHFFTKADDLLTN